MTTARQSKLKFIDSAEVEEGDYECVICYTELSPNSGLAQTACCLKLACSGCMMQAFYHSLMARDQTFKCPMCRGIIMENPNPLHHHVLSHDDNFTMDLASNLDSMDEADLLDTEEPEPEEDSDTLVQYSTNLHTRYHISTI